MTITSKIIATILIFIASLFVAFFGFAIASSSHNVNHEGGANLFFGSPIVGVIVIIAIWLPWKKLLKTKK